MAPPSLATLLVSHTKAEIYSFALKVATAVGLPVSSWQPGDPTRSLYHVESEFIADALEPTVANYIASGFLDYAHGIWLKILAKQVFNVDVPDATYATADVVLGQASMSGASAGSGLNQLNSPEGVFVDASGALWVADTGNNRVLKFTTISTGASTPPIE